MRVVRGRLPGVRVAGEPSTSQVICNRVPRQKPRPGIAGELCSQPPDGVAETILPHLSITSMWQVSPLTTPWPVTVGSPSPVAPVVSGGMNGSRPATVPGRSSRDATSVTSRQRSAVYSGDSSAAIGVWASSPNHASRSARASFSTSRIVCAPSGSDGSIESNPSSMASICRSAGP